MLDRRCRRRQKMPNEKRSALARNDDLLKPKKKVKFENINADADDDMFSEKPAMKKENTDDEALDVDLLDGGLERKRSGRALKTEGYESDEFEDEEEGGDQDSGPRIIDKNPSLDDELVEGQESDPSTDDEEIQIEPFNMKSEFEEGKFNEDDLFVSAKDEDRHHDNWLDGISSKQIKSAAKAHAIQAQSEPDASDHRASITDREVLLRLISLLDDGDSVTKVLSKLGKLLKPASHKKTKNDTMDTSISREEIADIKLKIEKITELCDILVERNFSDIYGETKETLSARLKPSKPAAQTHAQLWQYKWKEDGEIYGPYPVEQMKQWREMGYFATPILVQKVVNNQGVGRFQLLGAQF